MITLYHGTIFPKDIPGKLSRYGFPAIFYTPSLELAHNFAKHWAQGTNQEPVVRKRTINAEQIDKVVDFENNVTYVGSFRSLVYDCRDSKILRIKNCLDRPSDHYPLIAADIYVFYG